MAICLLKALDFTRLIYLNMGLEAMDEVRASDGKSSIRVNTIRFVSMAVRQRSHPWGIAKSSPLLPPLLKRLPVPLLNRCISSYSMLTVWTTSSRSPFT